MDKRELQLIQELMEQLQDEMSYGKEDLAERLGRKHELEEPDLEIIKVKGEPEEVIEGEEMSLDMDEMDESPEHEMMEEEAGPEESLKRRLMKLRGE